MIYNGKTRRELIGEELRAYRSWNDQRGRCNNKKNKGYRWYGAKGIKVLYTSQEFVAWWVAQNKKGLTCDRIDSSGHYCFGNIQLLSQADNTRKIVPKYKTVICHHTGRKFKTVAAAAKAAGLAKSTVFGLCNGHHGYKLKEKRFSYAGSK